MKETLLIIVLFLLAGCTSPDSDSKKTSVVPEKVQASITIPTVSDTTLSFVLGEFENSVIIKMPKTTFKGTILVLQGWNFPNTSWRDSSNLEKLASDAGFALVMPGMGKSIYHKRNYPETRKDWRKFPTRTWLMDTLIASMRKDFGLFSKDHKNFVMGLSTGGRGAFILAQENPEVFTAGSSLSGDYDQDAFPADNLYRGYFGSNPDNWSDDENPVSFVKNWSIPMYVAHGSKDSIVSIAHHQRLEEVMANSGISTDGWKFSTDATAGHDYQFWAAQTPLVINYFFSFTE
ncbi:MAG: alpha/beta hydrolase [Fluviicola sp.]